MKNKKILLTILIWIHINHCWRMSHIKPWIFILQGWAAFAWMAERPHLISATHDASHTKITRLMHDTWFCLPIVAALLHVQWASNLSKRLWMLKEKSRHLINTTKPARLWITWDFGCCSQSSYNKDDCSSSLFDFYYDMMVQIRIHRLSILLHFIIHSKLIQAIGNTVLNWWWCLITQ